MIGPKEFSAMPAVFAVAMVITILGMTAFGSAVWMLLR